MKRRPLILRILSWSYLLGLVLFFLLPTRVSEATWLGVLMVLGPPVAYFVPLSLLALWAVLARDRHAFAVQAATAVTILALFMDTLEQYHKLIAIPAQHRGPSEGERLKELARKLRSWELIPA